MKLAMPVPLPPPAPPQAEAREAVGFTLTWGGASVATPVPRSATGFTLVELVLTLVVLGILALVVLPRFFDATAFRARGYFNEILSAARHGQKLALASGCRALLEVEVDPAGYALLQEETSCGSGGWGIVRHPARAGGYTAAAPAGVTLSDAAIEFRPDGSSSGGTVTVDARSFTVVAATGYVREH